MNIYAIPPLVSAILFIILGSFVFFNNPKSSTNRTFGLTCLTTFAWQFSWFILFNFGTESLAKNMVLVGYTSIIFIPLTFYHFFMAFLKRKQELPIIRATYLLGVIFLFLNWSSNLFIRGHYKYFWGYYPKAGILHPIYLVLLFALAGRAFFLLRKELIIAQSSPLKYNQAKYLLFAMIIYTFASIDFASNYGLGFYPIGFIFILISLAIVGYAILRYRLMDIRLALTRAGVFVAVYTIVLGLPFGLAGWGRPWLISIFGQNWYWMPMLSLLALATSGPFLYLYIDKKAEEAMFKSLKAEREALKGYKSELQAAASGMNLARRPEALVRMIVSTMVKRVGVTHAGILLQDEKKGDYHLTFSRGQAGLKIPVGFVRINSNNSLIRLLKEGKERLIYPGGAFIYAEAKKLCRKNNLTSQDREILEGALHQMELFEAVVCIPSFIQEELLGILLLGNKNNGEVFEQEEVGFFSALASNISMTIHHAQLYREVCRQKDELEKAHEQLKKAYEELEKAYDEAVEMLNNIVALKDEYTGTHLKDSEEIAESLAEDLEKRLGITLDKWTLKKGSRLHDIGKAKINPEIIRKPKDLTSEEWVEMRRHPIYGKGIVTISPRFKDVGIIIEQHHECPDGKGYPYGLKIGEIKIESMIVSVVDSYLAMTSERSYNKGKVKTAVAACKELVEFSGRQFDYQAVFSLIEVLSQKEDSIRETRDELINALERKLNNDHEYMAAFNKMIEPLKHKR